MKEGWEYIALSSVCKVQNGFAFNSKLFNESNNGLPLIRIRDIKRGYSLTYTSEICSDEFFVEDGDMLIGMDGDFNIGEWKGGHALLNQRVCKLIPSEKILAKFIFYFIPEALQRINDKTAFSTVKHLSSKQVNAILLPNLPLSEQQSIVDYLDSAFAKIDTMKANAEKAINEAKALFQASLKEMLEPKEGWEEKKFGEVCWYNKNNGIHKGTRYVGMEHIEQGTGVLLGTISSDEVLSNTFAFSKGDVLYGRLRPYLKKVIVADFDGCCSTEIFPVQSKDIAASFLMYWFLTDEITNKVNATCAGCRMPRGNMNDVLKFDISYPPHSEQQSIVDTLDSLKSKVNKLQENYNKISQECDALKQAILRQVFE